MRPKERPRHSNGELSLVERGKLKDLVIDLP